MFLQYILKEDEESLLHKFLLAQISEPKPGDWWSQVVEDLDDLKIETTLHNIQIISKDKFKNALKIAASKAALEFLECRKASHKKK